MKENNFIHVLRGEWLKSKNSLGVWMLLLFTISLVLFVDGYLIVKSQTLDPIHGFTHNPWFLLGRYSFQFLPILYPIAICILCYSFCEIEYRNNSYKLIFTLPIRKGELYIAKVTFLIEVICISALSLYALLLSSGYLFGLLIPSYHFQDYDTRDVIFAFFWKLLLSMLSIVSVQYFISLFFKNFAVSIGFGLLVTIISMLISREYPTLVNFIPHYLINKTCTSFFQEITIWEEYNTISLGYILLFSVLGYLVFKKKSNH